MSASSVARLLADALRVCEMTGVVIGHARRDRMAGGARPARAARGVSLTSRTLRENASARDGPGRIVAQQVTVFLHRRPAAGGVDGDEVDVRRLEGRQSARAQTLRACSASPAWSASAPQQPCARGASTSQPSAASTRAVASFTSPKNARWTQPVTQPHPHAALAGRRRVLGQFRACTRRGVHLRRQRQQRPQPRRQQPQKPPAAPQRPRTSASGSASSRRRRGYGSVLNSRRRNHRSPTLRE